MSNVTVSGTYRAWALDGTEYMGFFTGSADAGWYWYVWAFRPGEARGEKMASGPAPTRETAEVEITKRADEYAAGS
ncbi:MAG TPA: hypothetical protein VGK54_11140 [Chloroflexota bacterium]|jgi:hypothetical protein